MSKKTDSKQKLNTIETYQECVNVTSTNLSQCIEFLINIREIHSGKKIEINNVDQMFDITITQLNSVIKLINSMQNIMIDQDKQLTETINLNKRTLEEISKFIEENTRTIFLLEKGLKK